MKKIETSLKIEFILFIILIISLISSFFTKIYTYTEIIMGIVLLIMSYNNQKHFKKKYLTYIYLFFGLLVIGTSIYSIFNG